MNVHAQLVEESQVAMRAPLATSPVQPGAYSNEDSVILDSQRRVAPLRNDAHLEFESWRESAISYAKYLWESLDRERATSISFSRLAHAQMAAGLVEEAKASAENAIKVVVRRAAQYGNEEFDHSSALASLRILAQLDKLEEVEKWLGKLPSHNVLRRFKASIATQRRDYNTALELLRSLDSADAASLRGYIYLQIGSPQKALRELRTAIRENPHDANAVINIAFAYWHLGSPEKAVRYARQAIRIAPTRRDIGFALFEILLATGREEEAQADIKFLQSAGLSESSDLLTFKARVSLALGQPKAALIALRRALAYARKYEDPMAQEVAQTNVAVLEVLEKASHRVGGSSQDPIIDAVRAAIRKSPENVALVEIFAARAESMTDAPELRRYYQKLLTSNHSAERLYELSHRLAYLEGRFDEALSYAIHWSEAEPFNPQAASMTLILMGQLRPGSAEYSSYTLTVAKRFGGSPVVLNNVAFALALCGRADLAKSLISKSSDRIQGSSFHLKATAGLVEVALGKLQSGMKLYRLAAEEADKFEDGHIYRSLMTIHQAMALRQLGLLNGDGKKYVLAQALPDAALPEGWKNMPHFRLLEIGAERRGWGWPLQFD